MKNKIIVALMAAVALCVGAYYYFTKVNIEPPIPHTPINNIVGSWKLDSIYNTKDSNSFATALVGLLFDSATIFKFNVDSSLQIISPKKTEAQHYVLNNDSLFVTEASNMDTFYLRFANDNTFTATSTDNSSLRLKRIKDK